MIRGVSLSVLSPYFLFKYTSALTYSQVVTYHQSVSQQAVFYLFAVSTFALQISPTSLRFLPLLNVFEQKKDLVECFAVSMSR